MIVTKCFCLLSILYFADQATALPTVDLSGARSIGATVWDWLSYPFTWWSSDTSESVNEQLTGSATRGPFDNIEVGKRNITVWCNDHTCTTMKCNKSGCSNITCNIYETDLSGECREYNTEKTLVEVAPTATAQQTTAIQDKPAEAVTGQPAVATVVAVNQDGTVKEERPLELEAAMSSTVHNGNVQRN